MLQECDTCNRTFASLRGFQKHICTKPALGTKRKARPIAPPPRTIHSLRCPICSKDFKSPTSLALHLRKLHSSAPPSPDAISSLGLVCCPRCRQPYTNLANHIPGNSKSCKSSRFRFSPSPSPTPSFSPSQAPQSLSLSRPANLANLPFFDFPLLPLRL